MAVIAFNDAWVMSAWGKANGVKGNDIVSIQSKFALEDYTDINVTPSSF